MSLESNPKLIVAPIYRRYLGPMLFVGVFFMNISGLFAHQSYLRITSDHFLETIFIKTLTEGSSIILPLKRAGKLIMIDAIIDSTEGNLILDTGAMGIVLNSIYFKGERRAGGRSTGGITGNVHQVKVSHIPSIILHELRFEDVKVDITDLGHLEEVRKVKILGFFGLNLLKDFELMIDLQSGVLELRQHDNNVTKQQLNGSATSYDLKVPVYNEAGVLFINAKINQKNLSFCLDTGAEKNVMNSYLSDKILNTVTVQSRSRLTGSGKAKVEVYHGVMNDFNLGGFHIGGMQTIITNLNHMSDAYGVHIDGMLGCDFFERGIIIINMKKRFLAMSFYKTEKP